MNAKPVFIQALGMASPVGLTADSTCAAILAGITRVQQLPYFGNDQQPLRGSYLATLDQSMSAGERWLELLAFAFRDMLSSLSRPPAVSDLPLILALPPHDKGDIVHFLAKLGSKVGLKFDPRRAYAVAEGALGGYRAIAWARSMLDRHDAVVVGAADCLVTANELLRLEQQGRLLTERNADGIIPGEAAACLLLTRHRTASVGAIRGLGFGSEPGLLTNDIPLRADGALAAARAALEEAGCSAHQMSFRLSDAAGEGYSFKEQALVVTRLLRQRMDDFPLWLCASRLGYVRAAAGLCNLVWATRAFIRGYAPGPSALAWASDDAGERAALVLDCRGA